MPSKLPVSEYGTTLYVQALHILTALISTASALKRPKHHPTKKGVVREDGETGYLDVVSNDGDISEVQSSVNFIHNV